MLSRRPSKPLLLRIDRWRDRLEELLGGLSQEITSQECHEIRESLGRLATWLHLAGSPALRERVKSLRRAAGPVRDIDVTLERIVGPSAKILERRRRGRSETLRLRILGTETGELLRDLREIPAVNYSEAESAARRLGRRVRKAGAAFAEKPTRTQAHCLRRRLREYRFAREWLRLPTSSLKPLIRRLGQLNDDTVVLAVLRDLGLKPEDFDIRVEDELKACRTEWKALRRDI